MIAKNLRVDLCLLGDCDYGVEDIGDCFRLVSILHCREVETLKCFK